MKNLKQKVIESFESLKDKHILGRQKVKFAMRGNYEPQQEEIEKIVEEEGFHCGFVMDGVSVIHDGESFTRIVAECYDADRIMDHIRSLEGKVAKPNEVLKSALNKAITMLDDYNNMYGDEMPKTEQISELDEILKSN